MYIYMYMFVYDIYIYIHMCVCCVWVHLWIWSSQEGADTVSEETFQGLMDHFGSVGEWGEHRDLPRFVCISSISPVYPICFYEDMGYSGIYIYNGDIIWDIMRYNYGNLMCENETVTMCSGPKMAIWGGNISRLWGRDGDMWLMWDIWGGIEFGRSGMNISSGKQTVCDWKWP